MWDNFSGIILFQNKIYKFNQHLRFYVKNMSYEKTLFETSVFACENSCF